MPVGETNSQRLGVSVVICCHNSAELLPAALAHLRSQVVQKEIPWEVILVDNASTDRTTQIARECWPQNALAPLRVVHEPRLGLSNARQRGFAEASYEIVSFVDDDNGACPDWVATISRVMGEHAEVGACMGIVEPVFESDPPAWTLEHALCSTWPGPEYRGDVTETLGALMGAGLSVRLAAYKGLTSRGFRHMAVDREGTNLTGYGDYEICLALRLAGWRLWVEPGVCLQHFIPAKRLKWEYWRSLVRGVGLSTAGLDPYWHALATKKRRLLAPVTRSWTWQTLLVLKDLSQNMLLRPRKVFLRSSPKLEGDQDVLRIERYIGRLLALLKSRGTYSSDVRRILQADWRR
jgi:glycosyltransferase involved in cell wall biosynthesis